MDYEFVRVKSTINPKTFRKKILNWLFEHPERFVWNYIFYHILIIIFTIGLKVEVPTKVILRLAVGDVQAVQAEMQAIQSLETSFTNFLFVAIILIIDLGLLLILKSEFKSLKLNWTKIAIIEVFIFALGIINPYVRTALFFFGTNTLYITIAYRWFIKKWIVFQYFFVGGSYILILKLLFVGIMSLMHWRWTTVAGIFIITTLLLLSIRMELERGNKWLLIALGRGDEVKEW